MLSCSTWRPPGHVCQSLRVISVSVMLYVVPFLFLFSFRKIQKQVCNGVYYSRDFPSYHPRSGSYWAALNLSKACGHGKYQQICLSNFNFSSVNYLKHSQIGCLLRKNISSVLKQFSRL